MRLLMQYHPMLIFLKMNGGHFPVLRFYYLLLESSIVSWSFKPSFFKYFCEGVMLVIFIKLLIIMLIVTSLPGYLVTGNQ